MCVCVCLCVCIINSLSCLNEKKWKKTWKKIKNENIDRKMLRRKNQLSVDENIWEALFVFEIIEARWAASMEPVFGNEESKCLT